MPGGFADEWLIWQQLLAKHPEDLGWREARLRAGLEAREFGKVLDELEEWQGSFLEAGRTELLREMYGQLKAALPQEKRVLQAIGSIGQGGEVRGGAPEPKESRSAPSPTFAERDCAPTDDPAADQEELLEIAELTEMVEEAEIELPVEVAVTGEPEEIPLEFLEEIELSPVVAGPVAEPESAQEAEAEIAPEAEMEIELELEFELELELESQDDVYLLETEKPAAELTGEIDEPMELADFEIEPEESLPELTLDETVPGRTGKAAAESPQESYFDLGAELIDLDSLEPDETLARGGIPVPLGAEKDQNRRRGRGSGIPL